MVQQTTQRVMFQFNFAPYGVAFSTQVWLSAVLEDPGANRYYRSDLRLQQTYLGSTMVVKLAKQSLLVLLIPRLSHTRELRCSPSSVASK